MMRALMSPSSVVRLVLIGLLVAVGASWFPAAALATVSVSRAELSGTRLKLEGQAAANRTITVDSVAMTTSDGSGNFKIDKDPFAKPADCTVDVNDGSATATAATLSGCTVSSSPPPPPAPPPPPPPPPTTSPAPALASLTITPHEVIQGASATGTVTLTSAASSGGLVVQLTNDYADIATVPASVTVAPGATSASFPVATAPDTTGSAIIVGTVGGDWSTNKYDIITTYTAFQFNNGSISILPGGTGSGRVTSSPAGIDCAIVNGNGSGACSAFFPVGTVVRLDARAASGSEFRGWRGLPGCSDPSRVRVARGTNITCQPGFYLK